MSPRAACRLEALGFEQVYDYVPGKADWLARGLPREGEKAGERRAVDAAQPVVTCTPTERVEDVRQKVAESAFGFAVVVAKGGTVLGRLRKDALEGDGEMNAQAAMEPGPSTVRADLPLEELRSRLDERGLNTAVVTDPDGRLLGVVHRRNL